MHNTEVAPSKVNRSGPGRSDLVAMAAIVVVLGATYVLRLLPELGFSGDVVKFQFAAPLLGTVHETGYPVYLVAGWVFTKLVPIGSYAVRMNVMSAFFSLAAAIIVFRILRLLHVRSSVGAIATIIMGLSPLVLLHSVVAEVYTLNLFLISVILLLLLGWHRSGTDWPLIGVMAVVAISLGNHMTTVLLVPGILVFLWKSDRRRAFSARMIGWAIGFALLALSLYGYQFWRAADPTTAYVETRVESFVDLIDMLLGGRFRGRFFGLGISDLIGDRLPVLGFWLLVSLIFLVAFVPSGYRALRGHPVRALLSWWVSVTLVFAVGYDIPDIAPYLIPVVLGVTVISGVGMEGFVARRKESKVIIAGGLVLAVGALVVGLIGLPSWGREMDAISAFEDRIGSLPPGSVVAADYPESMILFYRQLVDGDHRHVALLPVFEEPGRDRADDLLAYFAGNPALVSETGATIDVGRAVFTATRKTACFLAARGFAVDPSGGVFVVRSHDGTPGSTNAEDSALGCAGS